MPKRLLHLSIEEAAFGVAQWQIRQGWETGSKLTAGKAPVLFMLKCSSLCLSRSSLGLIHFTGLLGPLEGLSSTIFCQLFSFSGILYFWFIITNCSLI